MPLTQSPSKLITRPTSHAPALEIPPGLEVRNLPFKIGSGRTLATGVTMASGEERIRLRFFYRPLDGHLIGKVWFGEGADGPPGHVHGGASAYVLDEAMGSVGWMNHFPILAAHLDFDYLRPTPLMHDLSIEAWISETRGLRITIRSRLMLDDKVCVEGRGEFAVIARSKISQLADPSDPKVQELLNDTRLQWINE